MKLKLIKGWKKPYSNKILQQGCEVEVTNGLGNELIAKKIAVKSENYNQYLLNLEQNKKKNNNNLKTKTK